jgi:hypothetical protein
VPLRSRLFSPLLAPLVLSALTVASRADAQTDLERARALFDEAGELERKGDWTAAQDRLRAALRIRETPHLRYALAFALENSDRLLEARTEYEVALRLAQQAGADEVSKLSATRIIEVDKKTPLIQVRVSGALSNDSHVYVDGREVMIHGDVGTLSVDPGMRVLRVERSGKGSKEETVSVAPGVLRVVEIPGDEGAADLPSAVTPPASDRRSSSPFPWVFVVGGGALAVTGVALLVSSTSDASSRDESTRQWCDLTSCVGGTATRTETADAAALRRDAYDAADRGNTKQIAGAILGGVGVVGVAVGAYMLVKRRAEERPAATSSLRLDAAPLTGGGIAGATVAF